jgi:NadR type nicotinamide-nucleotide adenylyltransferase
LKKIVITGPESTGKSDLSKYLANYYNTFFIPEFARKYIENLNRKYTFNDVVEIAKQQIIDFKKEYSEENKYIFFDTGLIITKIWFEEVYGKIPSFLEEALLQIKVDLYLICYPDIEWKYDKVRENGGEKRNYLFKKYLQEIENQNVNYKIVKGVGLERYKNAIDAILSA